MGKLIQLQTKESLYDGPFDSTVGWHAAGMGYIIVTDNGRLIVIDGGCPNDASHVTDMLCANAHTSVPEVDLWILTHPHSDHTGALNAIARDANLSGRIKVRNIMYSFPSDFIDRQEKRCNLSELEKMEETVSLLGAATVHPATDMSVCIDSALIHILHVPEDMSLINRAGNANFCSVIFTVSGSRKKIMFTGDAAQRNMQLALWRYSGKLKCDILQMPHHGLCDTSNLDFYKAVGPDALLIPTCIAGYRCMHSDMYSNENLKNNLWAEENAGTLVYSYSGDFETEI